MAQERIEDIISKEALDSVDQLRAKVDQATTSFETLINQAVEFNKKFGSVTNIKEFTNSSKQLDDSQKQLDATQKQLLATQQKLAAAQSDSGKQLASLQVQLQEQNKTNKDSAKALIEQGDAYKQLERSAAAAEKEAKQLATTFGLGSKEAQEATTKAKALNDQLKAIDASVGKNQRNVGNYSESYKILEQELARVTQKINTLNTAQREAASLPGSPRSQQGGGVRAASEDITQLTRQQAALQQVVDRTTQGFTSLTQQLRTDERALQTLRYAGLQNTEAFKQLEIQTVNSKREFNEFAKGQKILESSAPALTGLTIAAKGLAGAYAFGAGAAALFGDEEGKIDKEVQKLVAIMTVLQGLNEAHELLMQKNAIATAVAAAAQKAYAFVVGESTGALAAFRVALAATGIGLFIIALGYVITHFDELFKKIDPVVEEIDKLDGVTQQAKNSLKAYGKTTEDITKGVLKDLNEQTKTLNDNLGLTPKPVDNARNAITSLTNRINTLNKEQKILEGAKNPFDEYNASLIDANAKEIANLTDQLAALNIGLADNLSKQHALDQELFRKETNKAAIESFKLAQDLNNRQLDDQKTGLKKRLALIEANYTLERLIIQRTYDQEIRDADGNRAQTYSAEINFQNSKIQAERKYQDDLKKVRDDYRKRDAKAQTDINQRSFQQRIDFNKKTAENENELPEIRIQALRNGLEAEKKLLLEQKRVELSNENLTDTERENIRDKFRVVREQKEKETTDKIFSLQVALVKSEINLYKSLTDNIISQLAKITDHTTKGLQINNDTFNEFYDSVKTGLENLQKLSFKQDPFGHLLSGLIKFKGNIADTKEVDQYIQGVQELEKNLEKLGSEFISLGEAAVNAKFENEKNAIQEQINLIDQRRDHDIAAIQASQKTEEQKAAAIAIINARADSQKRIQEQRQKQVQIQQARFEKAITIAKIIAETAAAVIKAFSTYGPTPLGYANAAVVGAIGIAQAAIVAATPIPQYGEGTLDHPGGKAIVGDAGRSELVVTPKGKLVETPALPTLMDLEKGSIVLPDAKAALASYYGGMTVQKYSQITGDDSLLKEIKGLRRDVKNKQETHWHRTGNNWEFITNNGGNYQKWIDQNI